ncbi:hypothetical protein [Clostridium tertium]|uniref:hypothetical protein n=1 Tax=Clostridium tertium TaxID=1559 RepID=UPI0023B2D7D0|nr:hypothetical protein [Clostridium tertium]
MENIMQVNLKEKAFSKEEQIKMQAEQKERLYKELNSHREVMAKIKRDECSDTLNMKIEQAILTKQKDLINWIAEVNKEAEKEMEILKVLKNTDAARYHTYNTEVQIKAAERSAKSDSLYKEIKAVMEKVELDHNREIASRENSIKNADIITDLTIDGLKAAYYTCNQCGKVNKIKYNEMPSIEFGTVVNNISIQYMQLSKRVSTPLYFCKKCGKPHIYPVATITEIYRFASNYLKKYARSVKDSKAKPDKFGVAYIFNKAVFNDCCAVELDTSSNMDITSVNKLNSDKLEIARELANLNSTASTEDGEDVFNKIGEMYRDDINKDNSIEDKNAATELANSILNIDMLDKLDPKLLIIENNIAYESYSEDINQLTVEQLTAYGKLFSKEIQIYLNDLDEKNYLNKDALDILASLQTDGGNLNIPKVLENAINERYGEFVPVDAFNMLEMF